MSEPAPFFAISVICWLAGIASYLFRRRKMASWRRTEGTVVQIKQDLRSDGMMSASVVKFRAVEDGRMVTFQDGMWSSPPSHQLGEKVQVVYERSNPSSAMIAGYRQYLTTFIWVFVAAFMLGIGVSKLR